MTRPEMLGSKSPVATYLSVWHDPRGKPIEVRIMKNRNSWMTTWPAIGSLFLVSVAAIDVSFWCGLKIAIWMSAQ